MAGHELYKTESLGEGITATPDTYGYGSYFIRLTGIDHTEQTKPFSVNLMLESLNQLAEISQMLNAQKEVYELHEKQINCQHATVEGKCVNCGATEDQYKDLSNERYARSRY